jgi:hypothetical protein
MLMQYIDLWLRLQHNQPAPKWPDAFTWRWEASGLYSCHSSYKSLCSGQTSILGTKELWKVRAPRKCIFFLWLTTLGHSWTSKRCHRHHFWDLVDYAFCAQALEHIDHLLARCPFRREVWFLTFRRYGWRDQTPAPNDTMSAWWLRRRK